MAEVLITLTIIGVVAALTIPNLVQSYRKKVVEAKLVRFYSTIQQAIRLSQAENGHYSTWDDIGTECEFKDEDAEVKECIEGTETSLIWYNKYLAQYIKTQKIETTLSSSNAVGIFVYFLDGSAVGISGDGWNFYVDAADIGKIDNSKDSKYGTKVFPFYFYSHTEEGFQPFDSKSQNPIYSCDSTGNGANCTKVIADNNWKIPDDYPFKF